MAYDYAAANRPTYHLLYILTELAKGREISVRSFNMLVQSCSEFLGINADISIDIDGESWEESDDNQDTSAELTIAIEFPEKKQERTFVFKGAVGAAAIPLGPYLVNTSVTLPCAVDLSGASTIEAIGNCSISARSVRIETPDLILRTLPRRPSEVSEGDAGLFINAQKVEGHANAVSVRAGNLEIQCVEPALDYPLAKYVQKVTMPFADQLLREKYRRLRRIFLEFRSHKKGALAKYRAKIEHERVLRNELGRRMLAALLKQGILRSDPKFYYIQPDQCNATLGISWHDLRQHRSSSKLEAFLKSVS